MDTNRGLAVNPAREQKRGNLPPSPDDSTRQLFRCLSVDLEVGVQNRRIHAFAGVRPDTGQSLIFPGARGSLDQALAKLDDLAEGADFLLGHNLIDFDLPHLQAANPGLRLLRLPAVDTLRLNPLAFPRNPYHHLVKHYQDGQLKRGRINDPELDARLTFEVFSNQQKALLDAPSDLITAWHWLTTADGGTGFDRVFACLRNSLRPSDAEAYDAIHTRLASNSCRAHALEVMADTPRQGWALAYALAWLSVSGGNSVMPPWVRHQFPEAGQLVRRLRDNACNNPGCDWCRERHDARKELTRWFGFDGFRPEPADDDGRPMQQLIVEAAMAEEPVLAILPTGTGKSLCYQIPALSRYDKTGALTVVISPLVALMADQVAGLEARGIGSCVTVNGLLSMPERADALDRVRLVIHADIPGSLENYLQEAGRAGRDQQAARCVLLYTRDDVERQFGMSARSRLTRQEIHGVLRALRNLDRKRRLGGEVVATAGEILGEDEDRAFERDSATDDNRVRTALSWLEEAVLLTREENRVQVFPSSLRVSSVQEARSRLEKARIADAYRRQLLTITETLIEADADKGISTDELMTATGLTSEDVRGALHDLERLGIASNDTALTAFIHVGVEQSSRKRFQEAAALEQALIDLMREMAPDMGRDDMSMLHLRLATQRLKDQGHAYALPERLRRIVRSIAADGRGEGGGGGSLAVRERDAETIQVTLQREWRALVKTAELRRVGALRLLEHLLFTLPPRSRGTDLLAETTLGKMLTAVQSDLTLRSEVREPAKLMDRALLWLHEQEVIRLNKGLAVFRPAMTIRLKPERRGFAQADFASLKLHYDEQTIQIHVMAEYALQGLASMAHALRLAMDYFSLRGESFLRRWLAGRDRETSRQTTPESWRTIVEDLKNPIQRRIVADDRDQTNVLVLAGPGSGKTRVLVHRIAYLIRVKRENPRSILALAYNRHAAVEIRRRLAELIGDDARGVIVLTCHALAMRLVGASFSRRANRLDDADFQEVLRQAVSLLHGEGLSPDEADEFRARLLAGFRWILVDEYQDIGPDQYELISALAGRTLSDEDEKLSLFAVGDDDQNIYAFNGSSVEFIRRFEADYEAKPVFLTGNYRSTGHIVSAANALIEPARQRMKTGHPIHIDQARTKEPPGGEWSLLEPVARGQVQVLPAGDTPISQAQVVIAELKRLSGFVPDWNWSACAVVAREWSFLDPVRSLCELEGIPVQMANEEFSGVWHLRETRALLDWLRAIDSNLVKSADLNDWLVGQPSGPWNELLGEAINEYALETGGAETPVDHFIEWLAEWGREVRRRQRGLLLLTAHRAKGLEFDHVVVLDGGWDRIGRDEDADASRRLYYVATTRARQTLALARFPRPHPLQDALLDTPSVLRREEVVELPLAAPELARSYRRLSLRDVFLSFPGYRRPDHPVHRAIAALSPGDMLQIRVVSNRWELVDRNGTVVGQLAFGFEAPAGMRCTFATVLAVVGWDRERSEPQYRDRLNCDSWEVVVPELVFEPDS